MKLIKIANIKSSIVRDMAKESYFSAKEIQDIVISTLALGFIFSISQTGVGGALKDVAGFVSLALTITLIVALSFIPHELMHKFTAIRYKAFARYEMWKNGLLFALFMAVAFGFVFAAPGAVVIYTAYRSNYGFHQVNLSTRQNGIISSAGVVANLTIAGIFLLLAPQNALAKNIININAFLAMFNLLPIPPLDGSKVVWWNIPVWLALMGLSLMFLWIV